MLNVYFTNKSFLFLPSQNQLHDMKIGRLDKSSNDKTINNSEFKLLFNPNKLIIFAMTCNKCFKIIDFYRIILIFNSIFINKILRILC